MFLLILTLECLFDPISLLARKETVSSPKERRLLAVDCTVPTMFNAFLIP